MLTGDTGSNLDHQRWEQEHLGCSADHMRALAIMRRVESRLYAHDVEIMTHRAEIAAHEHAMRHGTNQPWQTQKDAHDATGKRHDESSRRHNELMQAIFALEKVLA